MSIITDLTRMWLTRSAKPFLFQNEYDQQLPFSQCEGLGLYVHIPFCRELCGFCPYCKVQYDRAVCDRYLDRLIREIHLVEKQGGKSGHFIYGQGEDHHDGPGGADHCLSAGIGDGPV